MVLAMKLDELILSSVARLDTISKQVVCSCPDGGGRLLFDFKTKKFIYEGRCKLMLLCTIIQTQKYLSKLRERGYIISSAEDNG